MHRIFYTADVIRYDGSDTNCYGEGCEEGSGYELETGWFDPDWSADTVFDKRESVRPDVYTKDEELSPGPWLADRLFHRLRGWCPSEGVNGAGHLSATFYSQDADQLFDRGCDVTVAAHAYGFTDAELAEANELLSLDAQDLHRSLIDMRNA